ncbi:hypothetical protein [Moraxella cuniculi]|uniref:hypothetical protein n=1 Tax=Moraxella cuniculi TaxID=34061 RepID=UPI000F844FC0|nr:hypothetical protein [Moraxella cuniculi]
MAKDKPFTTQTISNKPLIILNQSPASFDFILFHYKNGAGIWADYCAGILPIAIKFATIQGLFLFFQSVAVICLKVANITTNANLRSFYGRNHFTRRQHS